MSYMLPTPHGYYFRIHVPKTLREVLKKREVKKPLHTTSRLQAKKWAAVLALQYQQYFEDLKKSINATSSMLSKQEVVAVETRPDLEFSIETFKMDQRLSEAEILLLSYLRQQINASPVPAQLRQPFAASPVLSSPQEVTQFAPPKLPVDSNRLMLSNAIKKYLDEKFKLSPKVTGAYRAAVTADYDLVLLLIGDLPVENIDRDIAIDMFFKLQKLPPNFNKCYPGLTLNQLIESNHPPRTGRTVNATMANASALFKWLIMRKLATQDYFEGLRASDESGGRSRFTDDELTIIFRHPVFTEHEFNYAYHYWAPLIALNSGMRLNEIVQLRLKDIREENSILVMNIVADEKQTKVKTNAALRRVPVHPMLIKFGFAEYVQSRQGELWLFDGLRTETSTGRRSSNASAWFSRFREAVGMVEHGKDFHSFRHTVVSDMIHKEVQERVIKAIVGHARDLSKDVLKSDVTFNVYGKMQFNIDTLYRAICALDYSHVLTHVTKWHSKIVPIRRISNFTNRAIESRTQSDTILQSKEKSA